MDILVTSIDNTIEMLRSSTFYNKFNDPNYDIQAFELGMRTKIRYISNTVISTKEPYIIYNSPNEDKITCLITSLIEYHNNIDMIKSYSINDKKYTCITLNEYLDITKDYKEIKIIIEYKSSKKAINSSTYLYFEITSNKSFSECVDIHLNKCVF